MCGENTEEGNTFKCCQALSTGTRQELAEPLPRAVSMEWQDRRLTAVGGWAHRVSRGSRQERRPYEEAGWEGVQLLSSYKTAGHVMP